MQNFYLFLIITCLVLVVTIVWLLKKNQLREKYALTWFFIIFAMVLAFLNGPLVEKVSFFLGIKYPPTLVFIAAILGLLLLNLMLSIIDSHQTNRIIALAQKVALLENKLERLLKSEQKRGDKK